MVPTLLRKEARARCCKMLPQNDRNFPRAALVPPPFRVRRICRACLHNKIAPQPGSTLLCFARFMVIEADHNRRSMISSNDPRGDDTKHSWMPAARACHNGRVLRRIKLFVDHLSGCSEDLVFHLLTFTIVLVKLCRERRCLAFIVREQ